MLTKSYLTEAIRIVLLMTEDKLKLELQDSASDASEVLADYAAVIYAMDTFEDTGRLHFELLHDQIIQELREGNHQKADVIDYLARIAKEVNSYYGSIGWRVAQMGIFFAVESGLHGTRVGTKKVKRELYGKASVKVLARLIKRSWTDFECPLLFIQYEPTVSMPEPQQQPEITEARPSSYTLPPWFMEPRLLRVSQDLCVSPLGEAALARFSRRTLQRSNRSAIRLAVRARGFLSSLRLSQHIGEFLDFLCAMWTVRHEGLSRAKSGREQDVVRSAMMRHPSVRTAPSNRYMRAYGLRTPLRTGPRIADELVGSSS